MLYTVRKNVYTFIDIVNENTLGINLWCVCLNWRAALCTTVQCKMNERLNIRKCHLMDEDTHY